MLEVSYAVCTNIHVFRIYMATATTCGYYEYYENYCTLGDNWTIATQGIPKATCALQYT